MKHLDFGARAGLHQSAENAIKKILTNFHATRQESRYKSYYTALKTNRKLSIGMNLSEMMVLDDHNGHSTHSIHSNDDEDSHHDTESEQKADRISPESVRMAGLF